MVQAKVERRKEYMKKRPGYLVETNPGCISITKYRGGEGAPETKLYFIENINRDLRPNPEGHTTG